MDTKQDQEQATVINKRLSDVKEDNKDRSKHRSTASETDCVISETSISEAVVKSVSNESFAVLEAGTTVKLIMPPKESTPKAENESSKSRKSAENENIKDDKYQSDKKTTDSVSKDSVSEQDSTGVIEKRKDNTPISVPDNSPQQKSAPNDSVVIESNQIANEGRQKPTEDAKDIKKGVIDTCQEKLNRLSGAKISEIPETGSKNISDSAKSKPFTNETEQNSEKQPPSESSSADVKNDSQATVRQVDDKQSVAEPTEPNTNIAIEKSDKEGTEITVQEAKTEEAKFSTELVTSELQKETSQLSSGAQENKETINATPEEIAQLAQKLTTSLAKQMVNSTSAMASQMIEASTNALTLYNGSTLELADIDYFVIYRAENPKPSDGISFIARMELGTHCLTKVIPVGPTRAWVAYSGGGIKLIDTESESALNKIDVQGLDTITTSEESSLFITTIKTFSVIERMHIVGEGVSGSAPVIRVRKNRIACFATANFGKNIIACVEKRNSCLCFPGKSEIVVQVYEMNGKRSKEFKPKVDGKHSQTTGFPIVMCENGVTKDICIALYNSSDHTCAVEVYDKHMERQFIYDGDKTLSPRFMCEDICCDKTGNILMLDNSLKSVHIVNSKGTLIKLISTPKFQIDNPKCINIDVNGRLWIGQGPPAQMIILEYSI